MSDETSTLEEVEVSVPSWKERFAEWLEKLADKFRGPQYTQCHNPESEVEADASIDSEKVSMMDRFTDWLLHMVWNVRVWAGLEDSPYDSASDVDDEDETPESETPANAEADDEGAEPESEDERLKAAADKRHRNKMVWIMVVAVLLTLLVCRLASCTSPATNPGSTSTTAATASHGAGTWKMALSDYRNNRWFADGISAIKNAKTTTQAAEAAQVWLDKVKPDPNLLVAAAKIILNKDVDKTTLFGKDGWATNDAVILVSEMQIALAQAKISPSNAPSTGFNSGVDGGKVVGAVYSGIHGNRKALKVVLANGTTFWILGRCGNIATPGSHHFPPGKTDEKDPSRDPYPRGNAPIGGGKNQDPGPGTYIPPTGMVHPPAAPRVNPSAPVVAPPTGSKPDPTPAPTPEPSAPTPGNPAKGYSPPPGM